MAIIHGRTLAQLRQSVGRNLGAVDVSSASGNGSTTTIVDNTLIGSDDTHIGKWVIFNDASGNAGQVTRVSDYTESSTTLTLSPAVDASSATSDTYELWDDEYNPANLDSFINDAILEVTGRVYDPIENLTFHTDGGQLRFDVPSGISMIQDLYYRNSVGFTRIHACGAAFDETVDSDITVSLDTKDRKQGSQSCKFVIAAGASAGDIATDSITSKDISGYDYIEMWVKSTVAASSGNLKLLLDNTASCASPIETLSIPALAADTWTFVRMQLSNPELDTAIISVGLEYDSDLGACTVWLDDISAVKNDTAEWIKIPRHLWRIDKEARDVVFDNYVHGIARYNLLKIVGGDKPALLSSDSDTSEVNEQYLIEAATGRAFAATSGGPSVDPDQRRHQAGFWISMANRSKKSLPMLTNVRLVE
jgi:hypothetical protein